MYTSFREFEKYYSIPYTEGKYDETLNLLDHEAERLAKKDYEENLFLIMLDKARIYSELHDSSNCFGVINDILDRGFAFPLQWKKFDFLKEKDEYNSIKEKNEKNFEAERKAASFKYEVHLPKSYAFGKKYPLFFSLHGDGSDGNIPNHIWYWKPDSLLEKGYIVVYPQSSQVQCHNGFGWLPDPMVSRKEIKECYEKLLGEYSIDEKNVIIAGFSGGSTASIDIAISGAIPAKGFVALCPGDNLNFDMDIIKEACNKGVKGVIFEGEHEKDPSVQDLLDAFRKAGLPCEYNINNNIGHWYPEDLGEKLSMAVDTISPLC